MTNLLEQWWEAANQLKELKEREMSLRKECVALFGPDFVTGKRETAASDGYKAVCEIGLNYTVKEEVSEVLELLPLDTVRWKPELSMRVYNSLTPELLTVIEPYVTAKPASPTLKIVSVK